MENMLMIRVITSEYEKLESYMKTWPFYYEITESEINGIITIDLKKYYIKMDICYGLDLDFLIDMKKFTNGQIAILGKPEELP